MSKKAFLILIPIFLLGGYFTLVHRVRELPSSVITEGISVIEEIKDIKITGTRIFNPGVVRLEDTYLFIYREKALSLWDYLSHRLKGVRKNILKITELDDNFTPIVTPVQIIPRKNDTITKVSDPRLFWHNGEVYLIFCDNSPREGIDLTNPGVQTLAKLVKRDGIWNVEDLVELSFPGAEEFYEKKLVQKDIEKNWTPFSLEGKLYVVYLLEPEKVVIEVDVNSGVCEIASRTQNMLMDKFAPLRGGTPPIYDEELGEFITIYHVPFPGTHKFTNLERRIYTAGACCFSKDKPFTMTKKSIGPFYEKNMYNTKKKIIFPTGLVREGDDYLMFYGEDDYRMRVARINREKLLSLMKRSDVEGNE